MALTEQQKGSDVAHLQVPGVVLDVPAGRLGLHRILHNMHCGPLPRLDDTAAAQSGHPGALFFQAGSGERFDFLCQRLHLLRGEAPALSGITVHTGLLALNYHPPTPSPRSPARPQPPETRERLSSPGHDHLRALEQHHPLEDGAGTAGDILGILKVQQTSWKSNVSVSF